MQASERRSALPVWRGWVQHAATGESHYFDCLSDLLAFVETQTGQPGVGAGLVTGGSHQVGPGFWHGVGGDLDLPAAGVV